MRRMKMSSTINFGIELPSECFVYLEDMSFYDHNYYKIKHYGDWFGGDLDVLLVQYHECENCYSYALGKITDGKFNAVVRWTTDVDIFD